MKNNENNNDNVNGIIVDNNNNVNGIIVDNNNKNMVDICDVTASVVSGDDDTVDTVDWDSKETESVLGGVTDDIATSTAVRVRNIFLIKSDLQSKIDSLHSSLDSDLATTKVDFDLAMKQLKSNYKDSVLSIKHTHKSSLQSLLKQLKLFDKNSSQLLSLLDSFDSSIDKRS